jgi:hypothetical protein
MAQTKRKRRTKHRGNAAGAVEVRGHTAKPRAGDRRPAAAAKGPVDRRTGRPLKPPSLQSALVKAAFGAVILFLLFNFIGNSASAGQAAAMAGVALVLYTPIMFLTDRWVYNRKMKDAARR